MLDETNVTATDTGNTTGGETTEEQTATEQDTQNTTAEGSEQETQEETEEEESAEASEFEPYDFDNVVKLPEGYTLPDVAKESLNEMGKELGIPADKIQLAVDKFIKVNEAYATQQQEADQKAWEKGQAETKTALLKDWGDDYEKNTASINKVLSTFFKESFNHMFGEPEEGKTHDLSKRPLMPAHFEKSLLSISKLISQDSFENGEAPSTGLKNRTLADACRT